MGVKNNGFTVSSWNGHSLLSLTHQINNVDSLFCVFFKARNKRLVLVLYSMSYIDLFFSYCSVGYVDEYAYVCKFV